MICRQCGRPIKVIGVQEEFRVRCTECRYSRGFGQGRTTAETYAAKHAIVKNHIVELRRGDEILRMVNTGKVALTGMEDPEVPPF